MNRAIGRNELARQTTADMVHFIDADYVGGPGFWDSVAKLAGRQERLFFPRETLISRDHQAGDRYINSPGLLPLDPADFMPKRERRSIGGIQITSGRIAREVGYCPQERWQRPTDAETVVGFTADREFRRQLETQGTAVDLGPLYRIRHSVTGDKRAERAGITPSTK